MVKLTSSCYSKKTDLNIIKRERDTIIAIVGKSGSGKSEIVRRYHEKGYNVIQSYTDRPQRYESEWGHIFIETGVVEKYRQSMIAYTFFDGHHYFATREQYQGKGVTFYVIDPYGVRSLKEKVKDADIIFVYINVDEEVRIRRMVNRMMEKNPDASGEIVQAFEDSARSRAEYDKKAFHIVECDFVVDNNGSLEDTMDILNKVLSLNSKKSFQN